MKKTIMYVFLTLMVVVSLLTGCDNNYEYDSKTDSYSSSSTTNSSAGSSSSSSSSNKTSGSSTSSFTNAYGTSTTKCAHPGCNNYIASSGDTNCCTTHSNRCLNCNKYIDEDATYCMSCLTKSITGSSSGSSSSSSKGNSSSGSSSSSSSSSSSRSGLCQYKSGGQYVCNKKATNGNYCKEHYDYLNDAYNSLFGH